MPPRSEKMKRRIFGFQRRVWWPKWTPASRSSRMVTTDTGSAPFLVFDNRAPAGRAEPRSGRRHPRLDWSPGRWLRPWKSSDLPSSRERRLEIRRQRRLEVEPVATHGMPEAQAVRVQELPLEPQVALRAVLRIARHGQVDRREVHADLVRAAGLEPDVEQRVLGESLSHLE